MYKKILLCVGITILFLGTCITPSVAIDNEKKASISISPGNTLYVGGSGEYNYTKIQEAIDDASDGDTVFVYNGTYYEKVVINTSINLIGENKYNTTIDGEFKDNVTRLISDYVNISGFTIKNSISGEFLSYGIGIYSLNNKIKNNIILDNNFGIYIDDISSNNDISDNIICSNIYYGVMLTSNYGWGKNYVSNNEIFSNLLGIMCYRSLGNIFYLNEIYNNSEKGIELLSSQNNTIINNSIINNTFIGIYLVDSNNNTITFNKISNNGGFGIYLLYCRSNSIINNNIIKNGLSGIFLNKDSCYNIIISNNISLNSQHGIRIIESNNNTIKINNLISNKWDGIFLYYSNCNILTENRIVLNNDFGICFAISSNNNIKSNTILNNRYGLLIGDLSYNNIVIDNNILENDIGIELFQTSNNNTLYHNNLTNNGQNAQDECENIWDNGYPSGGNYWSDYDGEDKNGDGIGDTPYSIPGGDNEDRYPLMVPWSGNHPPTTPNIEGKRKFKVGEGGLHPYTIYSIDTDGDDISYIIDWGNGEIIEIGPYPSGEEFTVDVRIPLKKGTYILFKIKARDIYGGESDWATLEVTVPRTRAKSYLWYEWLMERFPLLEKLLGWIRYT